uniref:cell division protein ZapA n=1 Tax=Ndongobacter massiliensis TaxID=1871025 RepID=UPI00092FE475|nr:cell division protein ZapA [Ndongobacter massiliensis]
MLNKLRVTIGSNEYVLKSARPNAEMQQIVEHVRNKVEEARTHSPRMNPTMQATLAAINIADELFELRASLDAKVKEEVDKLRLSSAVRPADLQALQKNLQEAEKKITEIQRQFQSFQNAHR